MLLRKLNSCEGLCNGTRLVCCYFEKNTISAEIASGDLKSTHVFILGLPLLSSQIKNYLFLSKEHNSLLDYVFL